MNGQGGFYFCSLVKKKVGDFWLKNKSLELLQEYILTQYMEDDKIDDEWRIPDQFRFDIFNNINSLCLWESESVELNNSTICDIYRLGDEYSASVNFEHESQFSKHKMIDSFLCTDNFILPSNQYNWKLLLEETFKKYNYEEAYLIYFKANARGYATHDDILKLQNPLIKSNLKFYTGIFGSVDFSSCILKKAFYNPNSLDEKILYDFRMFKSAREKPDFDFTGIQEVSFNNSILRMNWIK